MTDYTGDFDTLREVKIIGPYSTPEERDAELKRLEDLLRNSDECGFYELNTSTLDPAGADCSARAEDVATASSFRQVTTAFH